VIGTNTPGVALASAAPFATFVDKPLGQPRLNALLLAVFAASCVTLCAIGLFAVMSTMVRQRRRELGIRMAVGATPADVRRMILLRGLAITGSGITAGLLGGLLANRLLTTLLYGVPPTDPVILLAVTAVVVMVTATATMLPALAGGRVSAVIALRVDN
jgi:ABC-type antimicrobial peptide transport system permease subunit